MKFNHVALFFVRLNEKSLCVVNQINMLDDLGRNTAYDTTRGNIFHNNGICSDDAVVAYGYASYDFGSGTNQHVVSDYGAFVAVVAYGHLLQNLAVAAYSICCNDGGEAMLYQEAATYLLGVDV